MSLVKVDIPSPRQLRTGWAILAALDAARGANNTYVFAEKDYWYYNDGGGNWACLRFKSKHEAVLFGNDHDYSETYFREAARDFGEKETDLLSGAPSWWADYIEQPESQPYIGFIYGWDNDKWMRASYKVNDGFKQVGLLQAIRIIGRNSLSSSLIDRPKGTGMVGLWSSLKKYLAVVKELRTLVAADADIKEHDFEKLVQLVSLADAHSQIVFPLVDVKAGVVAAKQFLAMNLD